MGLRVRGQRMELKRSWLFVPGNRQRMVDKALGLDADVIMLDIEDGVTPAAKPEARERIASALDSPRRAGPWRFVRINDVGHPDLAADLDCAVQPGLDGLVLPKVESPEQVRDVAAMVADRERARGLPVDSGWFLVSIESPRGLLIAPAIATSSPRIMGLMFGAEDFGRELGLPIIREREARELIYARSAVVVAAAAGGVQAIDGVWPDLNDTDGLSQDCQQARRLGFSGKSLIHPSQIAPINAVFSPTRDDLEYARWVIAAFEEAQARGEGAIAFGGQLIDLPVVERARQTIRLAENLGIRA